MFSCLQSSSVLCTQKASQNGSSTSSNAEFVELIWGLKVPTSHGLAWLRNCGWDRRELSLGVLFWRNRYWIEVSFFWGCKLIGSIACPLTAEQS